MLKRLQIQSINETLEASLQQQSTDAVEDILVMKEQLIAMVTRRCDSLVGEVWKTEKKGRISHGKQKKCFKVK